MFVDYTYQDWVAEKSEKARRELLTKIITAYKGSADFVNAATAQQYYESDNVAIKKKYILQADAIKVKDEETGRTAVKFTNKQIEGNRVRGNFFQRLVDQQSSYLLGNGVTLVNEATKAKLGGGFDTQLARIGQKALVHSVCWGFWNHDHLETIKAYTDQLSGAVALLDERTSEPMVLIQFWQISEKRSMHVRVFEIEGISNYCMNKDTGELEPERENPSEAYILNRVTDGAGVVSEERLNYGVLPCVPLYANEEKRSEMTLSILSKIDLYDRIFSDFGDNLDMANDVYWVLNNFGGNSDEALQMMKQIHEIKAVINISDGVSAGSTAEPHSFEVPYEARQAALELLRKAIFDDYMGLDMSSLTGGYLTNIAIKAAMTAMDLKADHFEWQCFDFVQKVLRLVGVTSEQIRFKRRTLTNDQEIIQNIYMMREDIDQATALKLNPMIDQEDIDEIMKKSAVEKEVMGDIDGDGRDDTLQPDDDNGNGRSRFVSEGNAYVKEREYRREQGKITR